MAVSSTESKTKAIKAAPLNLNPVDMSCKRIYPFLASIRIKGRRRSPRSYHYQEKDLFYWFPTIFYGFTTRSVALLRILFFNFYITNKYSKRTYAFIPVKKKSKQEADFSASYYFSCTCFVLFFFARLNAQIFCLLLLLQYRMQRTF